MNSLKLAFESWRQVCLSELFILDVLFLSNDGLQVEGRRKRVIVLPSSGPFKYAASASIACTTHKVTTMMKAAASLLHLMVLLAI